MKVFVLFLNLINDSLNIFFGLLSGKYQCLFLIWCQASGVNQQLRNYSSHCTMHCADLHCRLYQDFNCALVHRTEVFRRRYINQTANNLINQLLALIELQNLQSLKPVHNKLYRVILVHYDKCERSISHQLLVINVVWFPLI